MSERWAVQPYRARVRYAECDAWGELQPFALYALFDAAVAHAFGQLGVDWREMTKPGHALRAGGVQMNVSMPMTYDDEVDFIVTDVRMENTSLDIDVHAQQASRAFRTASAVLSFVSRSEGGTLQSLPPELTAALDRIRAPAVAG